MKQKSCTKRGKIKLSLEWQDENNQVKTNMELMNSTS